MRPEARWGAAGAAAGAAAAVAARALWLEPRRLVVRRRTLRLPRWPPALDGVRVAVVSDLHAGAPHVDAERLTHIVARVNRTAPDLVALLGDYVDPESAFAVELATGARTATGCAAPCALRGSPCWRTRPSPCGARPAACEWSD
jgi:hypothetical protein